MSGVIKNTGNIFITNGHNWPTMPEVMKCSLFESLSDNMFQIMWSVGYYKLRDGDPGVQVAFEMLGDNRTDASIKLDSGRARKSKFTSTII